MRQNDSGEFASQPLIIFFCQLRNALRPWTPSRHVTRTWIDLIDFSNSRVSPPRFLVLRISRGFAVWVAQFFSSRSGQPCFAVKQSKARETLGQIMVAARKTHFGLMDTSHTYIHTCIFDVVVHIRSNSRGKGQVYPSDSCLIQN